MLCSNGEVYFGPNSDFPLFCGTLKNLCCHSSSKLSGRELRYWPSSPVYLRSHRHHGATILGSVAKYFENTDNSNDDGTDSTCVVNVHPKPCQ